MSILIHVLALIVTISFVICVKSECVPFPSTPDTDYCSEVIDYLVDSTLPLDELVRSARHETYPFPQCLYYDRKEYRCKKRIPQCDPQQPGTPIQLCMSVCNKGKHASFQGHRCSEVFTESDFAVECNPHYFSTDADNCLDIPYTSSGSSHTTTIIVVCCMAVVGLALVAYLVYRRVHNVRLKRSLHQQDAIDAARGNTLSSTSSPAETNTDMPGRLVV